MYMYMYMCLGFTACVFVCMYPIQLYVCYNASVSSYFVLYFHLQALFFGGGWVFFMRKLFKNFEVHTVQDDVNIELHNQIIDMIK